MSWLVCGTVPNALFPLCEAVWTREGDFLRAEKIFSLSRWVNGKLTPVENFSSGDFPLISIQRGTPALLAAALAALQALPGGKNCSLRALLVGDTGNGAGSRGLYRYMQQVFPFSGQKTNSATPCSEKGVEGITFHYLYPDVDGHSRVQLGIDALTEKQGKRPILVADAGFMYVAKMSGYAELYDIFTPDAGEMAFLADEHAPHPFYTRGFLLAKEDEIPELISRAQKSGNCARHLLIKGKVDRIVCNGQVLEEVSLPNIPFMEPIGGTGDMITGLLTALLATGFSMQEACSLATHANREAGALLQPTPATQVAELIPYIPEALEKCLQQVKRTQAESQQVNNQKAESQQADNQQVNSQQAESQQVKSHHAE